MARQVFGTQAIIDSTRRICRLVARFGTSKLALQTSPEFAAAVAALVAACEVFEALDDYGAVTDRTAGGTGANDEDLSSGSGTLANELEDA